MILKLLAGKMICNSTPLIHLAKINQLKLLKGLFNKVIIPEAVKDEVLVEGKPGYSIILGGINQGWIKIKNPKNNINFGRGKGENAAISLAKEENDTLIIDDTPAIRIADSLNVKYIRTTAVILLALKKKVINKIQSKNLIHKLAESGYYISSSVFSETLRIIDSS